MQRHEYMKDIVNRLYAELGVPQTFPFSPFLFCHALHHARYRYDQVPGQVQDRLHICDDDADKRDVYRC